MMPRAIAIALLSAACLVRSGVVAQTPPALTVTNAADPSVEIVPVDAAHAGSLPQSLGAQAGSLPPGSFLLKNHTGKTVTGLAAVWTFTDADGKSQQHKLVTDAYYLPIDWKPIKPFGALLVTPGGYATEEQFQAVVNAGIGRARSRIWGPKALDETRLVSIKATVDSVIYEDGGIWGPDTLKYYQTLLARRSVLEALSNELKQAKSAGEDFKSHAAKIAAEVPHSNDQRAVLRRDYAAMLQRNPDPEALLKKLEAQAPLPEFHHLEGGVQ